jgi:homoserine kinase
LKAENENKKVTAFGPATVANVGCGFDVLGFAVDAPGDKVTARFSNEPGVTIAAIRGDEGRLPLDAAKNTAGVAVLELLRTAKVSEDAGISLEVDKQMPIGSGLGSSAASSAAAAVAVNRLLGEPFSVKELLPFAMEAERVASGAPHADNVAAALLGGFVLVRSSNPLDVVSLHSPPNLHCTVVHPKIEIRTEDTRNILRKQVPLKKAVIQWGNLGALVAGLMKEDYELIGRALHDEIIEPIRSVLIPGYDAVKKAAMSAGALGCSISGSGPSVFALNTSREQSKKIGDAMMQEFENVGLKSTCYTSKINRKGTVIEE